MHILETIRRESCTREKRACIVISSGHWRPSTSMLEQLQFLLKNSLHRVPRVQSDDVREKSVIFFKRRKCTERFITRGVRLVFSLIVKRPVYAFVMFSTRMFSMLFFIFFSSFHSIHEFTSFEVEIFSPHVFANWN